MIPKSRKRIGNSPEDSNISEGLSGPNYGKVVGIIVTHKQHPKKSAKESQMTKTKNMEALGFYKNWKIIVVFLIGLIGGWFVEDAIVISLMQAGVFQPICIAGIHFHHLYLGIILAFVGAFTWILAGPRWYLIAGFIFGVGLGLFIGDAISHVTWDAPFSFYC
jgi:hypothetical protein